MRWENETEERPVFFDYHYAKLIIIDAYHEGFINWNIYQKAIDKVTANMRGGWMFEKNNIETGGG